MATKARTFRAGRGIIMKLKVYSVDFELNEITFKIDKKTMNEMAWCFGDECEVDLTTQLARKKVKNINENNNSH